MTGVQTCALPILIAAFGDEIRLHRNPQAQRAAKRLFGDYLHASEEAILMAESVEQQALIGSKNQIEAVMSQMEKRKGQFVDP